MENNVEFPENQGYYAERKHLSREENSKVLPMCTIARKPGFISKLLILFYMYTISMTISFLPWLEVDFSTLVFFSMAYSFIKQLSNCRWLSMYIQIST